MFNVFVVYRNTNNYRFMSHSANCRWIIASYVSKTDKMWGKRATLFPVGGPQVSEENLASVSVWQTVLSSQSVRTHTAFITMRLWATLARFTADITIHLRSWPYSYELAVLHLYLELKLHLSNPMYLRSHCNYVLFCFFYNIHSQCKMLNYSSNLY